RRLQGHPRRRPVEDALPRPRLHGARRCDGDPRPSNHGIADLQRQGDRFSHGEQRVGGAGAWCNPVGGHRNPAAAEQWLRAERRLVAGGGFRGQRAAGTGPGSCRTGDGGARGGGAEPDGPGGRVRPVSRRLPGEADRRRPAGGRSDARRRPHRHPLPVFQHYQHAGHPLRPRASGAHQRRRRSRSRGAGHPQESGERRPRRSDPGVAPLRRRQRSTHPRRGPRRHRCGRLCRGGSVDDHARQRRV
ncbi:uncharacterized protein METZ01_LOCUS472422, partial [marine metagenome]